MKLVLLSNIMESQMKKIMFYNKGRLENRSVELLEGDEGYQLNYFDNGLKIGSRTITGHSFYFAEDACLNYISGVYDINDEDRENV